MQRVHWDPEFAQRSGNPTTFDYGRMRETWLIHLCTDWMGDDAWLWKLDCEFRLFNYVGDTQWVRGTVARKLPGRRRPPGRRPRPRVREPAGRGHHARPRHGPPAEPRARPGAPARRRPAAPPTCRARSRRSATGSSGVVAGGSTSIATPPPDDGRGAHRGVGRASTCPRAWREAADGGGAAAIREVRSRAEYEAWYPTFADAGLVAATWPVEYGGLDVSPAVARAIDAVLRPYNLGRLNPLGLNLAAPALFAHGTEEQRLRFLPPIVRNEERWCQLFSEPGAGSDLASLATRAERDGDEWVLTGQKVWTTWAHVSDFGVCLARTDPDVPKRKGITYFLVDLHAPGVEVRPLRHITGEVDFNEVFLDGVRVPDAQRVGRGRRRLAGGQRHPVGRAADGVGRRVGRRRPHRWLRRRPRRSARRKARGAWDDPVARQRLVRVWSEEQIRGWTNQRVRAGLKAGRPPGPESSIGKVHQGELNQRIQLLATDLLGAGAMAWEAAGAYDDGAAVRDQGHAAQPGQHDRGRHHRGEQERDRRAGARPAPRARPLRRRRRGRTCRGHDATRRCSSSARARSAGWSSTGPTPATPWTPRCSPSSSGRGRSSTPTRRCG